MDTINELYYLALDQGLKHWQSKREQEALASLKEHLEKLTCSVKERNELTDACLDYSAAAADIAFRHGFRTALLVFTQGLALPEVDL